MDELRKLQRGRCANPACRQPLGKNFHRDHIVPIVRRGANTIRNIQLLCEPCNLRKGAKDPLAWAREQGALL